MAKFYVESGKVSLVLQAANAHQAAIQAFQWSCDRQASLHTNCPLEHVQLAERLGWQLEETIFVSEQGFGQIDAEVFDTLDIVAAWQGFSFPWTSEVANEQGAGESQSAQPAQPRRSNGQGSPTSDYRAAL